MTLAPIPALLAVLFCAALFVLLFQYLFPRRAPWTLAAVAVLAGIIWTVALSEILHRFVAPGLSGLDGLDSFSSSLPFAILRVGLPEEGAKALAALVALSPFWRRVTPAQAFQASLFAAIGFAIVENQGYSTAFSDAAMLMAFGRGFLATLTHSLLAMIFGRFLMRFAARGWRSWHLLIIGYLVAAGCHAIYDAGMLPILSEYLRTKTVSMPTLLTATPIVIFGVGLVLIAGLWSLRRAIRIAARDDMVTIEAHHQAVVRRWRWSGNALMILGILGLVGAIVSAAIKESPHPEMPDMQSAVAAAIGFAGAIFGIILGWVLRQKR
ncbi:MAG: PrsW family glutamic-type intramembrane protease [Dongiaceae bacterium]